MRDRGGHGIIDRGTTALTKKPKNHQMYVYMGNDNPQKQDKNDIAKHKALDNNSTSETRKHREPHNDVEGKQNHQLWTIPLLVCNKVKDTYSTQHT